MTDSPGARVLDLLRARQETLATAESLTGGQLAAALTEPAGASAAYRGGVIAYATGLKATLAGVTAATLDREGPVAAATALEMAAGVRRRCGADWGLAVTGVAGPESQAGHPVGQVFVALAGAFSSHVVELALAGSRAEIRAETEVRALALLEAQLRGSAEP